MIDRSERRLIGREPEGERDERLVDRIEHAMVGRADRGRAAEAAHLDVEQGRPDEGLHQRVDGGRRQVREQDPLARVWQRDSGSMFTVLSSLAGSIAMVSIAGRSARSGARSAAPSSAVPMQADSTMTKDPPRRWSGRNGASGSCSSRPSDSQLSGTVAITIDAWKISTRSIGQKRAPA